MTVPPSTGPAPGADAAIADVFAGPLAEASMPLIAPAAAPCTLPVEALLEPEELVRLLDWYGSHHIPGDRRGLATQWSKWYFHATLVPELAANLLLGRTLPLQAERLELALSPEGRPDRIRLPHAGGPLSDSTVAGRFLPLLEHLERVIRALARVSGAAPRVFWSNAGNAFEHCLNLLEEHPLAAPVTVQPGRALLERTHLDPGRRNPLYRPIQYLPGENGELRRVRRLCCIRYLLPGLDYCGGCPLSEPVPRSRPLRDPPPTRCGSGE